MPSTTPKLRLSPIPIIGLGVYPLLICATFICHFWFFRKFGVYEDDFWAVTPNLGISFHDLMQKFVTVFTAWPQGRPLNHFLPSALSYFGQYPIFGLPGLYFVGFLGLSLNVCLVFALIRKLMGFMPALVGALVYCCFPPDTTRQFLVHCAHVQFAMTFFLVGALFCLREGWYLKVFGYFCASLALLSYESCYLPFIAFPVFVASLGQLKRPFRTCLWHFAFCGVTLAAAGGIRLLTKESRALEALSNHGETVSRMFHSVILGPKTSLALLLKRGWEGWATMGAGPLLAALGLSATAVLLVCLHARNRSTEASNKCADPGCSAPKWVLPFLAALLTLGFVYVLTLINYPPTQEYGRFTSTHVPAAWPVCLLFAVICAAVLSQKSRIMAVGLGVAFVLMFCGWVSWNFTIQRAYVAAREFQSKFYTELFAAFPEVRSGTAIFFFKTSKGFSPEAIFPVSSTDLMVLNQVYKSDPQGIGATLIYYDHIYAYLDMLSVGDELDWRPIPWESTRRRTSLSDIAIVSFDGEKLCFHKEMKTFDGKVIKSTYVKGGDLPVRKDSTLYKILTRSK